MSYFFLSQKAAVEVAGTQLKNDVIVCRLGQFSSEASPLKHFKIMLGNYMYLGVYVR